MFPEKNTIHKRIWVAWLILSMGLVATLVATFHMKMDVEADAIKSFEFACSQIQLRIGARMDAHAQILRSAAAFFEASDDVTREDWHAFTERQNVDQNLPGIQGIGFSLMIQRPQLAQHIKDIRGQGFPDYKVRPEGDRETYTSIIYLEPFSGRNLRAFGYDMYTEPVRRMAMERSRDTGATLSGKVTLVQETDRDIQAGTLMYVPVYRKGMLTDTVDHRRAALLGWAYSPYRMTDLMTGILKGFDLESRKWIRLQIFDNEQLTPDSLLYDSNPKSEMETISPSRLTLNTHTDTKNHVWHLRFSQKDGQFQYGYVYGVFLGGTIISLLLFALIVSLLNTRLRAQLLADHLTKDLRENEAKYRIIFDNEIYAICIFDLETLKLIDINDAYSRLYGYSRQELLSGMTIHDITAEHQVSDEATRQATLAGTIFIPLRYHRKKDGTVFPVEIVGGPYVWKGKKVMFGLAHDITDRKNTEDKLLSVMTELQTILDTANIAISKVVDRKQVWVNRKTLEMFQYSKEELEGQPTRKLYPSDDMYNQLGQAYPVLAQGHVYETEVTLIRRDGTPIQVRYNGKAINPSNMSLGTIWLLEDITERKQAEKALRESEVRFRELFENNKVVKLIVNPDTGNITDANKAASDFYGWPIEELRQMFIQDINTLPLESIENAIKNIREAGSKIFEFQHRLADGSIRDVEEFSCKINIRGEDFLYSIIYDITDRKRVEMALLKSEERLTLAMKATNDALWDWDLAANTLYCSPIWWAMIGYEENELEACPYLWHQLMHPGDLERANLTVSNAIAGGPSFDIEIRLLHKNGYYVPVRTQGFILRDNSGKPIRVSGTITDLTERKKIEERRIHLERQQQRLQKAESLSIMAGAVAHIFNNQLGAVMGNLEIVMEDLPQDGEIGEILSEAMQAARKAASISSLMLTYLGQSVVNHDPMDLSHTCRCQLSALRIDLGKNAVLVDHLPTIGPDINADISQIQLVLKNLVANASEAIGDSQGAIHLTVNTVLSKEISTAHRFPIGWNPKDATYACMEIKDTGPGIADKDIDQVFDPFYTSKFTGRGLGLPVVLGIVRAHSGAVTVESKQNQGSVFKVFFPL